MDPEITFPVYRKYRNNLSYFKIYSMDRFEELKKEPKGFKAFTFIAKILPDRNFIHDMIFDFKENWVEIDEAEYLSIRKTLKA